VPWGFRIAEFGLRIGHDTKRRKRARKNLEQKRTEGTEGLAFVFGSSVGLCSNGTPAPLPPIEPYVACVVRSRLEWRETISVMSPFPCSWHRGPSGRDFRFEFFVRRWRRFAQMLPAETIADETNRICVHLRNLRTKFWSVRHPSKRSWPNFHNFLWTQLWESRFSSDSVRLSRSQRTIRQQNFEQSGRSAARSRNRVPDTVKCSAIAIYQSQLSRKSDDAEFA
jgi:hypothetical protein